MFPLFYNFQQAETTRRHEQVLEHVKEKVNEILNFKKMNHVVQNISPVDGTINVSSCRSYLLQ